MTESLTTNLRNINPDETFDALVNNIKRTAIKNNAPGILVGISGTDSILTFLASYEAYHQMGKPNRVKAVTFTHDTQNQGTNPKGPFECAPSDHGWVEEEIWPWLKERAPHAQFVIDDTIEHSDDAVRWGKLFSMATEDTKDGQALHNDHYFVAGTRNATEDYLGSYSLSSKGPSILPLTSLYKTEVLEICKNLGVPEIALQKSREIDCDCGRFETQANHLNEVDAYIMATLGLIPKDTLKSIEPSIHSAVQQFCIEESSLNAFRAEIPYKAPTNTAVTTGRDYKAAFKTAQSGSAEVKSITRMVPRLMREHDARKAHEMVTTQNTSNRDHWRPEAFTLLGTPGLTPRQKTEMGQSIFAISAEHSLDEDFYKNVTDATAQMGALGFSFPTWRFVAQGFGENGSLLERYGMEKQKRDTDVRAPDLPFANPERDELGTGFTWSNKDIYVEYRRSYIALANRTAGQETALIIRNNSFFYGRDRLADPVYVSHNGITDDNMKNITAAQLKGSEYGFAPWEHILDGATSEEKQREHIQKTEKALHILTSFDRRLDLWLRSTTPEFREKNIAPELKGAFHHETGGLEHLQDFLQTLFLKHVENKKPDSPVTLATIEQGTPPWQPKTTIGANNDLISAIEDFQNTGKTDEARLKTILKPSPMDTDRMVLISGPQGDYPATPG